MPSIALTIPITEAENMRRLFKGLLDELAPAYVQAMLPKYLFGGES